MYNASGGSAAKCGAEGGAMCALRVAMLALRLEPREQRPHRLAAMRALVLLRERQLRAGEPALGVEEMRVVAEARRAARRIHDRGVPPAFGEDRLPIIGVA